MARRRKNRPPLFLAPWLVAPWLALSAVGVVMAGCADEGAPVFGSGESDVVPGGLDPADSAADSAAEGAGTDTDGQSDSTGGPDLNLQDAGDSAPDEASAQSYAPCVSSNDCESGYCLDTWQGKVCAPLCDGSCADGWLCTQDLVTLPDVVFVCVPAHPVLCAPCRTDADCQGIGVGEALCLEYGAEGSFCGADCSKMGCPSGFTCTDLAGDTRSAPLRQCVLNEGVCPCSPASIASGASTPCKVENALGLCWGERACTEEGLADCDAVPASAEICNGVDDDCDGEIDEGFVGAPCTVDNAFGSCPGKLVCGAAGDSVCGAKTPAQEQCNGVDDNCDGQVDSEGALGCTPLYADADADGYGAGESACLCSPQGAFVATSGGDCNDQNAAVFPGQIEVCNGVDDNCDGAVDEPGAEGCTPFFLDADGDGWGQEGAVQCLCAAGGAWSATEAGDCDDGNAAVNPAALEVCNALDDDCDGVVDGEGAVGCAVFFEDLDGDGWGNASSSTCLCSPEGAFTAVNPGDCDDTDVAIYPAAVEICNGIDDNCNGAVDEGAAQGCTLYFGDADGDGYGVSSLVACACAPLQGLGASQAGDCNDADPLIHPGAEEACNGIDDNCNGLVDEAGALGCTVYFADADADGFGQTLNFACLCDPQGIFTAVQAGDCNDGAASISPQGIEVCNGLDDNCDGEIDEADADGCTPFYPDADGDGWGAAGQSKCLCGPEAPWLAKKFGDCDDNEPAVNPSVVESCNGIDDDCDGLTDEQGADGCLQYYEDLDGDGFGTEATASCLCGPTGALTAELAGDCNDGSAAVSPGATEVCNAIDDNCDGGIDEGCGLASGGWPTYKYDIRRTGHRTDVVGPSSPTVVWKYNFGTTSIQNSVAVVQDGIVAMAAKKLVKLSWEGAELWSHELPVGVFWRNTPTVREGGTILVPTAGELRLYSPGGALLWTASFSGETITAAPIVAPDGAIYVLSSAGLRKVDAAGKVLWVAPAPNTQTSPGHPAISPNGNIHFATSNHSVYSIIPESGQAAWVYTHPQGFDTDSSVAIAPNGDVYQGFGSTITRLSGNGVVLNTVNAGGDMDGDVSLLWDPVDDALRVYASPNGNSGLRRYTAALSHLWTYALTKDGSSNGVPVFDAEGNAYVGDDAGIFVCVRRNNTLRWSYNSGAAKVKSVAAVGQGFVVLGDDKGVLHFLGVKP